MKQQMKSFKYIIVAGMAVLTASCSDFLEEYSQGSYYAESWEYLDELLVGSGYVQAEATAGMTTHSNFGSFIHYLADELEENNISETRSIMSNDKPFTFGYYTWQQRSGQNPEYTGYYDDNAEWQDCYFGINVANNILAAVETVPHSTDDEIRGCNKVKAESYFLRAFYYFWLVNIYGQPYNAATAATDLGVPLKTSENVEDRKFSRNTVAEIYQQILSDLDDSRSCFQQYGTEKRSIYRADSTAANLLLSRIYLYMGRWQDCIDAADRVLSVHPALAQLNGFSGSFAVASNVENIFSMGGSDLACQMGYSYQGYRVNQSLYNLFDDNDLRKSQWYWHRGMFTGCIKEEPYSRMSSPSTPSDVNYYNECYKDGRMGLYSPVSSVFWMRSAEAYLNKAEAEACLGHDEEARKTVNHLRAYRYRTGAEDMEITSSGEDLIKDIREERRRELAFEGHRWFDLRRYRVSPVCPERISLTHDYTYYTDDLSDDITACYRFVLEKDDPSWTLPIPFEVLQFNTGMEGNGNPFRQGVSVEKPKN